MPIEKPKEFCIKDNYLVDGEMFAVQVKTENPLPGAATHWWRILKLKERKSRTHYIGITEDDRSIKVNHEEELIYRRPWESEKDRNLFVKNQLEHMGVAIMTSRERHDYAATKAKKRSKNKGKNEWK